MKTMKIGKFFASAAGLLALNAACSLQEPPRLNPTPDTPITPPEFKVAFNVPRSDALAVREYEYCHPDRQVDVDIVAETKDQEKYRVAFTIEACPKGYAMWWVDRTEMSPGMIRESIAAAGRDLVADYRLIELDARRGIRPPGSWITAPKVSLTLKPRNESFGFEHGIEGRIDDAIFELVAQKKPEKFDKAVFAEAGKKRIIESRAYKPFKARLKDGQMKTLHKFKRQSIPPLMHKRSKLEPYEFL